MAEQNTYDVTIEAQDGGPDADLRERWSTCASRRIGILDRDEGFYPEAGGDLDILDNAEGKFVWEMTPEEFEATPPSAVYLTIVSVDPAERPPASAAVSVVLSVDV